MKGSNKMLTYRIALQKGRVGKWQWISSPLTSLQRILELLNMYRGVPQEHLCVFLATSPEQLEVMLERTNQGLDSTAVAVDRLWDQDALSMIEVRRLEVELGPGGDHDLPYTWGLSLSGSEMLAWSRLLARRARGELIS
jgi:hypothetical protein